MRIGGFNLIRVFGGYDRRPTRLLSLLVQVLQALLIGGTQCRSQGVAFNANNVASVEERTAELLGVEIKLSGGDFFPPNPGKLSDVIVRIARKLTDVGGEPTFLKLAFEGVSDAMSGGGIKFG